MAKRAAMGAAVVEDVAVRRAGADATAVAVASSHEDSLVPTISITL